MAEPVSASPITPLDLAALDCQAQLFSLWRRAYQVEATLLGRADFPPLLVTLEALTARSGRFYGLAQEGRLLGAIEIEELSSNARQIAALVVDPDHARRGVGRRLVQFALEGAPDAVLVSTSAANTPALALYCSVGFRQLNTRVSREGILLCSLEWVRRKASDRSPAGSRFD